MIPLLRRAWTEFRMAYHVYGCPVCSGRRRLCDPGLLIFLAWKATHPGATRGTW